MAGGGGEDLRPLKQRAMQILREDHRLQQIVRLIGEDSLPEEQRMTLLSARVLREGYLQQNAFDELDRYALPLKQIRMLRAILRFCDMGTTLVRRGVPLYRLQQLPVLQELLRMKSTVANDRAEEIDALTRRVEEELTAILPAAEWPGEGGDSAAELAAGHSREELYAMARQRGIAGRSTMDKEELARSLAGAPEAGEDQP